MKKVDCTSITINTVTVASVEADIIPIYCEMRVNNEMMKFQIDC